MGTHGKPEGINSGQLVSLGVVGGYTGAAAPRKFIDNMFEKHLNSLNCSYASAGKTSDFSQIPTNCLRQVSKFPPSSLSQKKN